MNQASLVPQNHNGNDSNELQHNFHDRQAKFNWEYRKATLKILIVWLLQFDAYRPLVKYINYYKKLLNKTTSYNKLYIVLNYIFTIVSIRTPGNLIISRAEI